MIYQAIRTDTNTIVGEATSLGSLARAIVNKLGNKDLPRISLFDVVNDDRWYNSEKERNLARILMFEHDAPTRPMRDSVKESVAYYVKSGRQGNPKELAGWLAYSFGEKKLGPYASSLAWEYYLAEKNP
jgi:hypothetical protein